MNQIAPYISAIQKAKNKFNEINVNKLVNYDKEAMFAMQIVQGNDYLMSLANKNPESLRNAVINVASIGLSLNPAEKLAYIVPRKGKACLDVSYIGLIKLATDSGSIEWVRAELVYENDNFIYKGATERPEFSTPNPFNRGALQGVYCVAKTSKGDYLTGIMSLDECYQIRDRSEAYKAYQSKQVPCSWVTDEGEMIKKTIIKRESKTWPKTVSSERFIQAVEVINEHEGIEFEKFDPDTPIDFAKVEKAYAEALQIIDSDDIDEGCFILQETNKTLSQDEHSRLIDKLRRLTAGRKKYSTIYNEYLNHVPDIIDSHVVNG